MRQLPTSDKPSLGLIGVGLMGTALAERMLRAGFPLLAYDLDKRRSSAVAQWGGHSADSATAVLQQADWVVYSVMTTDDVEQSLAASDHSLRPGHRIIDTSTGHPDQMAALADRLKARGVSYLDATIAGNSAETRRGDVLALVGGEPEVFEDCRTLFDSFARQTYHLGPSGSGARMKLIFNLVLGLHRAVLAEALTFADKLGVDQQTALEILKQGTTYSRVMDNKGGKMLQGDFTPQARLDQHLKDVRLILEQGQLRDAHLPLSHVHADLLQRLSDAGFGQLDNSAILKAFLPE